MAEGPGEDADLAARLFAGEEAAFALLLDSWSGGMLRLARSIVTTEASAAEVVQETWLAVVKSVPGFEGRSCVRALGLPDPGQTPRSVAPARSSGRRRGASLQLGDEPTVDPDAFQGADEPYPGHWRSFPEPWPEQAVVGKETLEVIRAAVERLPAQQRAVITLRDIEGLTGPETSELLDLSEGNQRVPAAPSAGRRTPRRRRLPGEGWSSMNERRAGLRRGRRAASVTISTGRCPSPKRSESPSTSTAAPAARRTSSRCGPPLPASAGSRPTRSRPTSGAACSKHFEIRGSDGVTLRGLVTLNTHEHRDQRHCHQRHGNQPTP